MTLPAATERLATGGVVLHTTERGLIDDADRDLTFPFPATFERLGPDTIAHGTLPLAIVGERTWVPEVFRAERTPDGLHLVDGHIGEAAVDAQVVHTYVFQPYEASIFRKGIPTTGPRTWGPADGRSPVVGVRTPGQVANRVRLPDRRVIRGVVRFRIDGTVHTRSGASVIQPGVADVLRPEYRGLLKFMGSSISPYGPAAPIVTLNYVQSSGYGLSWAADLSDPDFAVPAGWEIEVDGVITDLASATQYVATQAMDDTPVHVRVRGYDFDHLEGDWSPMQAIAYANPIPVAPAWVIAQKRLGGYTFAWDPHATTTAPVGRAVGFKLFEVVLDGNGQANRGPLLAGTVPVQGHFYLHPNQAITGKTYELAAVGPLGDLSAFADNPQTTLVEPTASAGSVVDPPRGLFVVEVKDTSAEVHWTVNAPMHGYEYTLDNGRTVVYAGKVGLVVLSSLLTGREVRFQVRAVDVNRTRSGWSAITFKTRDVNPPAVITNLRVLSYNGYQAQIEFALVDPVDASLTVFVQHTIANLTPARATFLEARVVDPARRQQIWSAVNLKVDAPNAQRVVKFEDLFPGVLPGGLGG